ncbi:alpha/beta hydrolase [Corallococcus macrosporus]|uniref:Alpha/beta hydrolase n=1 Tax=Corallococcus macrosporus TaxID=35 RepID=A0ABS3DN15_9BACT|nr:alpha/beta hydrolase [Corallococcus macrosporus]
MTTQTVRSADGTSIAFETTGKGSPLILVGGSFCDRTAPTSGTPLAALLAHRFTVFSYDRRGRGDSGDTPSHALEREVEDLAALITAAGGSAAVFGNSSGGLLALDAAARGLLISKLVVYEPPVIREWLRSWWAGATASGRRRPGRAPDSSASGCRTPGPCGPLRSGTR